MISEFVKEGETTAEIEITLSNTGINAYRPDVYGETITICRSIGLTDSYEIKNSSGMMNLIKYLQIENWL